MSKLFRAWLETFRSHWAYLFALATSGILLYHFILIWLYGKIFIYEAKRPVLVAEMIMFSIIILAVVVRQISVFRDLKNVKRAER